MGVHLPQFFAEEDGATAVEYAIILSMMFLVIIGAVAATASAVTDSWSTVAAHIGSQAPPN